MKAVIQRVSRAEVRVGGEVTGKIGRGIVVLLGVGRGDTKRDADWLAGKIIDLRIFPDGDGKMNLSLEQVEGGLLIISQFTLFGDCRKGRRPSYIDAAPPEVAIPLYEYFVELARARGISVGTGVFQAMMEVDLVNEGPVTLVLETENGRLAPESSIAIS